MEQLRTRPRFAWLFLAGLLIVTTPILGRWYFLHRLPSRQAVEFVKLLDQPDSEYRKTLHIESDPRLQSADYVDLLINDRREFLSRSMGPWSIHRWVGYEQNFHRFVIKDSAKRYTQVTLLIPVDSQKTAVAYYWPYVKGRTLDEIADSAMKVAQPNGIAIGYWKDGKSEVVVRGRHKDKSALTAHEDRWPASMNASLIYLTLARMADRGAFKWDDYVSKWLPEYKLPKWAHERLTIRDLVAFKNTQDFPESSIPEGKFTNEDLDRYLRKAFEQRDNVFYGSSSRLSTSPRNVILMKVIENVGKEAAAVCIENEVLKPLEINSSKFERSAAVDVGGWGPQSHRVPFLAEGKGFSASAPDLIKFAKLKLDDERKDYSFLSRESFQLLHSRDEHFELSFAWEWMKYSTPKGDYWQMHVGRQVSLFVFPKENAVVVVALTDVPKSEHIDSAGPIVWRIAEEICGWPSR